HGTGSAERLISQGNIAKLAVAGICEHLVPLCIRGPEAGTCACRARQTLRDAAIYQRDIHCAVVVEIGHDDAEAGAVPARVGKAVPPCPVLEKALRALLPKRVVF